MGVTTAVELPHLSPDLLKHLFGLEELDDHDLVLIFVEIDLALGKLGLVSSLIGILLGNLPSSEAAHELRVVIHLCKLDRAAPLKEGAQFLLHFLFGMHCLLSL